MGACIEGHGGSHYYYPVKHTATEIGIRPFNNFIALRPRDWRRPSVFIELAAVHSLMRTCLISEVTNYGKWNVRNVERLQFVDVWPACAFRFFGYGAMAMKASIRINDVNHDLPEPVMGGIPKFWYACQGQHTRDFKLHLSQSHPKNCFWKGIWLYCHPSAGIQIGISVADSDLAEIIPRFPPHVPSTLLLCPCLRPSLCVVAQGWWFSASGGIRGRFSRLDTSEIVVS